MSEKEKGIDHDKFSGLRSQYLPEFAKRFHAAGYTVLLYDNRTWGNSEGKPRNEVDPVLQTRDYYDAFNYATTLPSVDRNKIVYWGTSMAGGNALVATAVNKCVKGVIAQMPLVSSEPMVSAAAAHCEALLRDRANVAQGNEPMMGTVFPASKEEALSGASNAILKDVNAFEFLDELARQNIPWEKLSQLSVFNEALHPKELKIIKGAGHFDPYYGPPFEENIKTQLKFLMSVFE
ncbi:hypothetical protein ATERTT37_005735 [Aspergillus terreus]